MKYSESQSEGREDDLFPEHTAPPRHISLLGQALASSLPESPLLYVDDEDDSVQTLPSMVLRERAKRWAIIIGALIVVLLVFVRLSTSSPVHKPPSRTAIAPISAQSTTPVPLATLPINASVTVASSPGSSQGKPTAIPASTAIPTPTVIPTPTMPSPSLPHTNLLLNPGFEGSGGWDVSAHSFDESGGHSGNREHKHWDITSSYTAYTQQGVKNLAPGVYQASAWIESSCSSTSSHFAIIDTTNGSELASYTIPDCLSDTWVQISITATIARGNATIKFTSNIGPNEWLRMDDVVFIRLD